MERKPPGRKCGNGYGIVDKDDRRQMAGGRSEKRKVMWSVIGFPVAFSLEPVAF
jgi:hypothetical protein